jgi:hypothetical protein
MREIKFRALLENETGRWWEYYTTLHEPAWSSPFFGAEVVVKDLQYTGLLDKNGREIYEGDAVKWYINSRAYLGLVEYVDRFGGFDMRNPGRDGYVCNDWLRGEYEVIGTIHENPELLS